MEEVVLAMEGAVAASNLPSGATSTPREGTRLRKQGEGDGHAIRRADRSAHRVLEPLHLPRPKGGEKKAFDIPLSRPMMRSIVRLIRAARIIYPDQTEFWLFPADSAS